MKLKRTLITAGLRLSGSIQLFLIQCDLMKETPESESRRNAPVIPLTNPVHRVAQRVRPAMLFAMAFCTLATVAPAAGGPPPTLREAIEAAAERHPRQQTLDASAREVDALDARASSLLADSPSVAGLYKTDQIGSGEGYREWEAGVALPLWKPGQRGAERDVANSATLALDQDRRALLLEVAGEVRERVWEAALARNNVEIAKKEWETAMALEKNVRRREELGELPVTDLLLAQDSTLTKRVDQVKAQAEFDNAMQRYASLTGLSRLPRQRGETAVEESTVPEDHPGLAQASANTRQALAELGAIRRRGGGSPELFVGGNGERDASGEDFDTRVALALSVPIGTRAHTGPALAAAERARADAQAEYEIRMRELTLALKESQREQESARDALALAVEQNRVARESLRLGTVAFDAGESDLVTLLRVQRLAFAAERREKELRIMLQRAISRYNQAAGVLP